MFICVQDYFFCAKYWMIWTSWKLNKIAAILFLDHLDSELFNNQILNTFGFQAPTLIGNLNHLKTAHAWFSDPHCILIQILIIFFQNPLCMTIPCRHELSQNLVAMYFRFWILRHFRRKWRHSFHFHRKSAKKKWHSSGRTVWSQTLTTSYTSTAPLIGRFNEFSGFTSVWASTKTGLVVVLFSKSIKTCWSYSSNFEYSNSEHIEHANLSIFIFWMVWY